jgi:hypothetical protein
MTRPIINETLENSENPSDLRMQMVDELTADEMKMPLGSKLGTLESLLWDMFTKMDDNDLQQSYDILKAEEESRRKDNE